MTRLSKPLISAGEFAEKIAAHMSPNGFPATAANTAHTYSEFSHTLQECVSSIIRMGEFSSSRFRATATGYQDMEQANVNSAKAIPTSRDA